MNGCESNSLRVHHVHHDAAETQSGVGAYRRLVVAVDVEHHLGEARGRRGGPARAPSPVAPTHAPGMPGAPRPRTPPRPCRLGSTDERCSGSTLVQWKAATSPAWSSASTRMKPAASNHGWAIRSCEVGERQPALLRVVGEGGGVGRQPGLLVLPGHERARGEARRQGGSGRVEVGVTQGPGHLVQLAHRVQPGARGQGLRGRQPAVRPEPRPGAASSTASTRARPVPCRRASGSTTSSPEASSRSRPVELGVPGQLLRGIPEQVADPAARCAEGEDGLLGQRADAVGGGRGGLQVTDAGRPRWASGCRRGGREISARKALDHASSLAADPRLACTGPATAGFSSRTRTHLCPLPVSERPPASWPWPPLAPSPASRPPAAPPGVTRQRTTIDVQLLSFNDFHGNLEPPTGSGGRITTGYTETLTPTGRGVHRHATRRRGRRRVPRHPPRPARARPPRQPHRRRRRHRGRQPAAVRRVPRRADASRR